MMNQYVLQLAGELLAMSYKEVNNHGCEYLVRPAWFPAMAWRCLCQDAGQMDGRADYWQMRLYLGNLIIAKRQQLLEVFEDVTGETV